MRIDEMDCKYKSCKQIVMNFMFSLHYIGCILQLKKKNSYLVYCKRRINICGYVLKIYLEIILSLGLWYLED